MSAVTTDPRIDDLIGRFELLESKYEILWDRSIKSHVLESASRTIWCAKLKHPRYLAPEHVKLLDQLYLEVRRSTWTIKDPYAEAIRLYEGLYPDGTSRNERGLSAKDRRKIAKAEKELNSTGAGSGAGSRSVIS